MTPQGRVALVTGASRGIGRAAALALARQGMHVALNYKQNAKGATETAKAAEQLGVRAEAFQADVADPEQAARLVRDVVARLGRLDVLVNNAGENRAKPFLEIPATDVDELMRINFTSAFTLTQEAAKVMQANAPDARGVKGSIVNVGSIAGMYARPGSVAYAAAKAAMHSLTMSAAEALAPHVIVNAVAPGMVDTELNSYQSPEFRENFSKQVPMRRYATPEEIAQTIAFFATGPAYCTGQILLVDGGIGNIYFRP